MYWAANMMLSQATNITTYGGQIQGLLRQWMCNTLVQPGSNSTLHSPLQCPFACPSR